VSDTLPAELYERLRAGLSGHVSPDSVFIRGWDAGVRYAIDQLRIATDEEPPQKPVGERAKDLLG
jgi:hypothetical protein